MKRSGWIWLLVGLVLALFAGILTFRTVTQATARAAEPPKVVTQAVVVAQRDIPVRGVITNGDIALKERPVDVVPSGAITSLDAAVGRISLQPLAAGEPLLAARLISPTVRGERAAFTMPDDFVLVALPANDLMSKSGVLQPGSRVDILVSVEVNNNGSSSDKSLVAMQTLQRLDIQALVAAGPAVGKSNNSGSSSGGSSDKATSDSQSIETALNPTSPQALLVAVSPQDALVLKYLKDAGGIFDVALRAPNNDADTTTEAVTIEYLADRFRFQIPVTTAGVQKQ